MNDESIFEAIKTSDSLTKVGNRYVMSFEDGGEEVKFFSKQWKDLMKDERFRNRAYELMEYEQIYKFANKLGNAEDYYSVSEQADEDTLEAMAVKLAEEI
jgi:hypothetical protein